MQDFASREAGGFVGSPNIPGFSMERASSAPDVRGRFLVDAVEKTLYSDLGEVWECTGEDRK